MAMKPLKAVVVYFTVSGHTQAVAESVAAALGADLERIEAAKPLPSNMFVLLAVGGFDEMAAIVGRTPFATMTIHDADRKSGGDVRLIERFVADVRARLVSSRMELPMASISGVAR